MWPPIQKGQAWKVGSGCGSGANFGFSEVNAGGIANGDRAVGEKVLPTYGHCIS